MPVWEPGSTTVACPPGRDASPRQDDASCVWSSSRQPRWLPTHIPTGRQSWLVCSLAWDATKPLWQLHENSWWRLVHPGTAQDGSFCSTGSGCPEVPQVCLPARKSKSSPRAVCCAFRSSTSGYFAPWVRTDQHRLGLEETHPAATLHKQSERRPKHEIV